MNCSKSGFQDFCSVMNSDVWNDMVGILLGGMVFMFVALLRYTPSKFSFKSNSGDEYTTRQDVSRQGVLDQHRQGTANAVHRILRQGHVEPSHYDDSTLYCIGVVMFVVSICIISLKTACDHWYAFMFAMLIPAGILIRKAASDAKTDQTEQNRVYQTIYDRIEDLKPFLANKAASTEKKDGGSNTPAVGAAGVGF